MSTSPSIVIDANIIAQLSLEMAGLSIACTASPIPAFDKIVADAYRVVLDDGDQVLEEWRRCVSPEWFESWYLTFVTHVNVVAISVDTCQDILNRLKKDYGFPGRTRDVWLVRTAATEAGADGNCSLLTEDIDFYEPKMKRAKNRMDYVIGKRRGTVEKYLEKQGVDVLSLSRF